MNRRGAGGLRHRLRYRFDNLLTRGTWAVLLWLAALTIVAVVLAGLVLALFRVTLSGSTEDSLLEDMWQTLLRTLDTGTMAADVGWGRRLLALAITIFGILVAGTLIGIIATGFEQRVEAMRRGRSEVPERDHIVVLGSSSHLVPLLKELSAAARTGDASTVVMLSEREPGELERELYHLLKSAGVELITRWGDPASSEDLAMVAVGAARAVIVLNEPDHGDPGVVRSVLAVGAVCGSFDRMPIIAELDDPANGVTLVRACGPMVHPVSTDLTLARVAAIGVRQPGMYHVVEDLLDVEGSAVYFLPADELVGHTFQEALFWYARCRPIGVAPSDGGIELSPDPARRFAAGEELIAIADDRVPERSTLDPPTPRERPRSALAAGSDIGAVIAGWSEFGSRLLVELDAFATPGSWARIVYHPDLVPDDGIVVPELSTIGVTTLASAAQGVPLHDEDQRQVTSIVLLGTPGGGTRETADAHTLLDLMMLRHQLDDDAVTSSGAAPRVVVEMLDADNVPLAQWMGADDYIVSDAIAGKLMTQLAIEPRRRTVLLELYGTEGPSIGLVDAAALGLSGRCRFRDAAEAAFAAGLLAIGWHRRGPDGDEVVLNPPELEEADLDADARVVVIGAVEGR